MMESLIAKMLIKPASLLYSPTCAEQIRPAGSRVVVIAQGEEKKNQKNKKTISTNRTRKTPVKELFLGFRALSHFIGFRTGSVNHCSSPPRSTWN